MVLFLGVVTYYRLLQTGVEDVVYARAISKIRDFFSGSDPARAAFFHDSAVDQVGLRNLGLWRLRWQQFLSAAATVAIVNSVVGGVFLAHQWRTWMRVAAALPMAEAKPHSSIG